MTLQPVRLMLIRQSTGIRPRPFLKWAGGKGQLLPELIARLPERFAAYHEPHVGSGALFFDLTTRGILSDVRLSDVNPTLIDTYLAVRDCVEDVIAILRKHQRKHDRDYYYVVRAVDPSRLTLAGRAARMIYLNKTCYNGLYRENKLGQFNVPFGRYNNPTICDAANLRNVSRALQGVDIATSCTSIRPTTRCPRRRRSRRIIATVSARMISMACATCLPNCPGAGCMPCCPTRTRG